MTVERIATKGGRVVSDTPVSSTTTEMINGVTTNARGPAGLGAASSPYTCSEKSLKFVNFNTFTLEYAR